MWLPSFDPELEKGLKFLNQKGVLSKDPGKALQKHNFLRYPQLSDDPKKYEAASKRLRRLAAQDEELSLPELPHDVHTYTEHEFPGYKPKHVIFLHRPCTLAQRFQRSGLCFMNGPVMVQYYREVLNYKLGKKEYPMLDLLKFLREKLEPDELSSYIFKIEGGDSHLFMKRIIGPDSYILPSGVHDIIENYKKYGPALVQKFEVREDFLNCNVHHHYGTSTSNKVIGYHSMALVGYRIDESNNRNKRFYLLQNWWREKQFIEVDDEYLKKYVGAIYFIVTPQTEIVDHEPPTYECGKYRNVEGIDKPECKPFAKSYPEEFE
jgi:hypothetical protein